MIISKTPYRISFFGGGTDLPAWYRENGGAVLSTTIDKYCYISCRNLPPFFEHKHRFVYSVIEDVVNVSDIRHPAIRGIFQWLDIQVGLEIHHDGDLPARSGLGSSSSFTVGLLNALRAHSNKYCAKASLAKDAIFVEQEVIGETVGSQDQVAAAYGGFNQITFGGDSEFVVKPVIMQPTMQRKLNEHLLLFFTGIQRFASQIEEAKLKRLGPNAHIMRRISQMVDEGLAILTSDTVDFDDFGRLLHEGWVAKSGLSPEVSSSPIDEAYQAARAEGALGGKLLGAGGGGFMLIFANPRYHQAITQRLAKFVHVPFEFENSGSTIALYQPSGL